VFSIIILLFIIVLLFTYVFNIMEKWNRLKEFRATFKSCANV
jgi:Tfp pilus assembly protein PilO